MLKTRLELVENEKQHFKSAFYTKEVDLLPDNRDKYDTLIENMQATINEISYKN